MKIAFIDHSFHKKTKSTVFLIEILQKNGFETDFFWDESWIGGKPVIFDDILYKYDLYIFFQLIPKSSMPFYKTGANIVYIPMLDSYGSEYLLHHNAQNWKIFLGCKVLCFSKTLANAYLSNGVISKFFQYYPNPDEYKPDYEFNNIRGFFWSRRSDQINWNIIKQLLSETSISSMHIHLAADPEAAKDIISKADIKKYNISATEWFESKDGYLNEIKKAQLYFAPRLSEGIGMSFLEAMAMGKCVIAPNSGTMNEYIQNGINGILYDVSYGDSWLPFENRAADAKTAKITSGSLTLNKEQIMRISKNARLSIETGYNQWKSRETELIEFIITNADNLYRNYYIIPQAVKVSDFLENMTGQNTSSVNPEQNNSLKSLIIQRLKNRFRGNKFARFIYRLYKKIRNPGKKIPLDLNPKKPKNDGINKKYLTDKIPAADADSIAGRMLKSAREGLLAEGGLRTKGIYRVSAKEVPLVTIITVVYNGGVKLERAVKSVIWQTYPNIEYIVVDGGSTDGSVDIIKKYADKIDYYVSQKDGGIYDAMNKGLALSQGEFIGIVNADDMMLQNGVYDAVNELLTQKADYVAAQDYCVDANGNFIGEFVVSHLDERCLVAKNPCNHGAMIIGRKVYNKIGYYDTKYKYSADFKLQADICMDKQFKGCKLLKNIHYFEMAGVSITQRDKSLHDVCGIISEYMPEISRTQVRSLVYFMHEKQWSEEICADLEGIIESGVYNSLQKDYLISEMKQFGYNGKFA